MATKAEIRDRAAQELGRLRLDQSLQNQDDVRISKAVDEVFDTLKEKGLAVWASTGQTPDRVTQWVVGMVAMNCSGSYGLSEARYFRLLTSYGKNGSLAEREIRNLVTPAYASQDEPTDY